MAFDWYDMRAMMIQAHGILRADDKFTFYYDETNNIRKFLLTDDGTNVAEHKNFVLGGIVLQEGQYLPEIASLRDALGMQDNALEIKFKHVASGDFEAVLASRKMAKKPGSDHRILASQFVEYFRTSLGNGNERLGCARWVASALFPFLQCPYRNPQQCGEPRLGQSGFHACRNNGGDGDLSTLTRQHLTH